MRSETELHIIKQCVCVYTPMCRPQIKLSTHYFVAISIFFFKAGSLTGPELDVQWTPGNGSVCISPELGGKHYRVCPFLYGFWDTNSGPCAVLGLQTHPPCLPFDLGSRTQTRVLMLVQRVLYLLSPYSKLFNLALGNHFLFKTRVL